MVFESHSFPPDFFDCAQIMQVLLYYFLFIIILGRRRKTKEQKLVQATESPGYRIVKSPFSALFYI